VDAALSAPGVFADRAVVITGASGDIGRAVAHAFAHEGARLGLVAGKRREALDPLVAELDGLHPGRTFAVAEADLLTPVDRVRERVEAARDTLLAALGGADALIALAGLPATPALWNKRFEEVTADDLHRAFAVDTVGTFLFAQAFGPALARARGAIIVMSSAAAFHGDVWGLAYAPAKSANAGLVKVLARVLAPDVRVNGIAPGGIDTGWLASLTPEEQRHSAGQTLVRRFGRPEEVAQAILDLAAPGYANGQTLLLDGGVFPPVPPDPRKPDSRAPIRQAQAG
jgi:NAD(P)-dependent dehydrogenase (short-subunit alcohol dehydrogenase family)